LRAYVLITSIEIDEAAEVTVIYKNFGQTPAYDLDIDGEVQIMGLDATYPILHIPEFSSKGSVFILGPGSERKKGLPGGRVEREILEALLRNKYRAFYLGTARYKDAFGEYRETLSCYFMGGAETLYRPGPMLGYWEGNSAT
jgi:hypothetical protein